MSRAPVLLWHLALLLLAIAAYLSCFACQTRRPEYSAREIENYSYRKPLQFADGWETGEADPSVLSVAILEEGIKAIIRGEYPNFHSVLIAHNGKLIFEEYFPGHNLVGEWNEHAVSYFSRNNDLNRFYRSRDPIDFVLEKKLVHEPGTQFNYNSGIMNLLGEIVHQTPIGVSMSTAGNICSTP